MAGSKKLGGVENRAAWWGKWGHGGRAATKRVKTGADESQKTGKYGVVGAARRIPRQRRMKAGRGAPR